MNHTNCPNCGAPLKDGKCEYCGTEVTVKTPASEIILTADSIRFISGFRHETRVGN